MEKQFAFRQHPMYRVGLWVTLVLSLALLWYMNSSILSNSKYIPVDDFSHYWAAGRLNISGENPYSPTNVQQLRNALTANETEYQTVPIMWTPPWSLPFVMPFGIIPYPSSRLLWLIVQVILVLVSANLSWKIYKGRPHRLAIAWVVAFIFGPTISVLEKGQISSWVLLGMTGFLYFLEERKQPFVAGLMIFFMSLKPHLVYLFWPAFLFWVAAKRPWKMLLGLGVGFSSALLIAIVTNPAVISDYYTALISYPPTDWATPTLGSYLRIFIGVKYFWLQFLPPVLGFIWIVYYWLQNRLTWSWTEKMPFIVFVSILTAPYIWTYDQVILVLAMVFAAVCIHKNGDKKLSILLWATFFGITIFDLILHRYYDEFWFGWLAPSLFLWFFAVRRLTYPKYNEKKPIATHAA